MGGGAVLGESGRAEDEARRESIGEKDRVPAAAVMDAAFWGAGCLGYWVGRREDAFFAVREGTRSDEMVGMGLETLRWAMNSPSFAGSLKSLRLAELGSQGWT